MPVRILLPLAAVLVVLAGCRHVAAPEDAVPPETVTASLPALPDSASAAALRLPALDGAEPISAEEHTARRTALVAQLQDGVFLALGEGEPEADFLPYSQEPNFRYLTGFVEPESALMIEKSGGTVRETIFVLPRNPVREVWEGKRLGTEGATRLTGIQARTADELFPALHELLARYDRLYTLDAPRMRPGPISRNQQIIQMLAEEHPDVTVVPVTDIVRRQRIVKSPAELDLIRRAVYITNLAHAEAMRAVEPGMNEFEIEALIEATFRRYGAEQPAFSSIVGSGPNSTTLHYKVNDRFMQGQDVVVMDIGASYHGYAADVTRTLPVNGVFSEEQRAIYQIVLDAQKAAEALIRPGGSWIAVNAAADRIISAELTKLGLIEGPEATYDCAVPRFADEHGACHQMRLYYMHGLGHGIGLDVHDPDFRQYGDELEPGMAFTIEPGVYVRSDALDYLPDTPRNRAMIERLRPAVRRYQQIGVRLEDDYIVTGGGMERITAAAPREVAQVEALMRQPSWWNAPRQPDAVEWYRR